LANDQQVSLIEPSVQLSKAPAATDFAFTAAIDAEDRDAEIACVFAADTAAQRNTFTRDAGALQEIDQMAL
jgi:hypothetical protein